jgi:hypothetical protein
MPCFRQEGNNRIVNTNLIPAITTGVFFLRTSGSNGNDLISLYR